MSDKRALYVPAIDEDIVLKAPGLYKGNTRSGWKAGMWHLATGRLFFFQRSMALFQVSLDDVIDVSTEKKRVVLGTRAVLSVTFRGISPCGPKRPYQDEACNKAWISVKDTETWRRRIFERTLLVVNDEAVGLVAAKLGPGSSDILHYIWTNGHATVFDLASLYKAPGHMDVLFKIRNEINPMAERLLGHRLLTFERVKRDEETGAPMFQYGAPRIQRHRGAPVIASWWIAGKAPRLREETLPIPDIFDEGDYLRIVTEVLNAGQGCVSVKAEDDRLTVSVNGGPRPCNMEIPLPVKVINEGLTVRHNNGILEVMVKKAGGRTRTALHSLDGPIHAPTHA